MKYCVDLARYATFGDGILLLRYVREVGVKWRLTFDEALAKLNVTHRSIDLKNDGRQTI